MSLPPRLTLCTYLNDWDPDTGQLNVNVLVIPVGDPELNLSTGWPGVPASSPFENASLELVAHMGLDPSIVPNLADIPPGPTFNLTPPPEQSDIFKFFRNAYDISAPQPAISRSGSSNLLKYLPTSYRQAFAFTSPITELAVIDDSFHCARKCPPETIPEPPPNDPRVNWGDVFAMLLRQPVVARAAGLSYSITLNVGNSYENGGWLFFTVAAGGVFGAQVNADSKFARWFGTRVPPLKAARPVFTAALFPIAKDLTGTAAFGPLDQVFPEAAAFDDGFSKIVHSSQAVTADQNEDGAGEFPLPMRDDGIRLGWDDEYMVMRLDRGISDKAPDGSPLADAPTGAAGYRVDVRTAGAAAWASLSEVEAAGLAIGNAMLPPFKTELMTEVHPSTMGTQFWVPPYYTRWRGGSLVAETHEDRLISGDDDVAPLPHLPIETSIPNLRYGESYNFRVRMVDAAGGGPTLDDETFNSADAPTASQTLKRFVPLGRISVKADPDPAKERFSIKRPKIGWPQALFAGAVNAKSNFAKQAQDNVVSAVAEPLGVADPDAVFVEFSVLVLQPGFDPRGDDAGYAELYRTSRAFPNLDAAGEDITALDIDLSYVDCARLSDVVWPDSSAPLGSLTGDLVLPTARKIIIKARALGVDDLSYYGDPRVRLGEFVPLNAQPLFETATVEINPFFKPIEPSAAMASVFLRSDPVSENSSSAAVVQAKPSPILAKRLAGAVNLIEDEGVLLDEEGKRAVFACRGLKYISAPDLSSIQLSSLGELPGQWLNVISLEIERDWTWLGYEDASFRVKRKIDLAGTTESYSEDLGIVGMKHTISPRATKGDIERESFRFYLIDAFLPMLDAAGLPQELDVHYEVTAHLRNGDTRSFEVSNRLPVAHRPSQIPEIVSTGHAFSDYSIIGDYEETSARQRVLWVEFAEPPKDPRDIFFARVLASTTDPLLMPNAEPLADPASYDKSPLDPEFVRVIRPGQPSDVSGIGAAQRLIPSIVEPGQKTRHFILPLPPALTANSPELFGFFTYEFTVGHDAVPADDPWWSMAQARFGPAMVLEGVQHPAPHLPLDVFRNRKLNRYQMASTFAMPVSDGRNLGPANPRTELWIVAYARLRQADGEAWRNVKISQKRASARKYRRVRSSNLGGAVEATSAWGFNELKTTLATFGLPDDTPLTFIAVELLPEPNGAFDDPLSGDLGNVRILRTSRLVSGGDACCP